MYISLTSQKPLRTNLQNFDNSDVFRRNDDFAWGSRIVFLLAKVLKCALNYETSAAHFALLHDMKMEVDAWYNSKPYTFSPIHFAPRAHQRDQRFPSLWMLLPVHGGCSNRLSLNNNLLVQIAVGLQYYHLAKIMLAVSSCPSPTFGHGNLNKLRNMEVCSCALNQTPKPSLTRLEKHPRPPLDCSRPRKIKP